MFITFDEISRHSRGMHAGMRYGEGEDETAKSTKLAAVLVLAKKQAAT